MNLNKQKVELGAITTIVTFIVTLMAITIFNIGAAIYSGIASGLSVTVGKEYGDSLIAENKWSWGDIIPGIAGVIIGILACIIFYYIR